MKKEILCPNCGTPIQINEETYEMLRNWKRRNFITFDKETGIYKKGESYIQKQRVA